MIRRLVVIHSESDLIDEKGVSRAEATIDFAGSSYTPILKAFAQADISGATVVESSATGVQSFKNTGPGRDITLTLTLDATFIGDAKSKAQVAVFLTNELQGFSTDFGTIAFEIGADSLETSTQLFLSPTFNNLTPDKTILTFFVENGQDFLIWAGLQVHAENGEEVDAFNTFTMSFDDDTGLIPASGVIVPAGGLDHFKCYVAEGDDHLDISIDLEDQFDHGPVRTEVEEPEIFCNPVDKNGEGIFDDTAHLTGYELDDDDDDEFESRTITISNQFGDNQTLVIEEPKLLLVPSEKDGVASVLNLDYYKCYEVEDGNDPGISPVSLLDQFGLELVAVEEPELFCNPADKNGEGILDDTAHLTCYEIEAEDADQGVSVINQLPDNQWLELEEAELLCVPSELIAIDAIPQPPEGDDDNDVDDDDEVSDDDEDNSDERGRAGGVSIYLLFALGMIAVIRRKNQLNG